MSQNIIISPPTAKLRLSPMERAFFVARLRAKAKQAPTSSPIPSSERSRELAADGIKLRTRSTRSPKREGEDDHERRPP
jgi:hypothetical protein